MGLHSSQHIGLLADQRLQDSHLVGERLEAHTVLRLLSRSLFRELRLAALGFFLAPPPLRKNRLKLFLQMSGGRGLLGNPSSQGGVAARLWFSSALAQQAGGRGAASSARANLNRGGKKPREETKGETRAG